HKRRKPAPLLAITPRQARACARELRKSGEKATPDQERRRAARRSRRRTKARRDRFGHGGALGPPRPLSAWTRTGLCRRRSDRGLYESCASREMRQGHRPAPMRDDFHPSPNATALLDRLTKE